ncbi:hypothetical protein [Edaphobacter aggregans]|uniref:hypothetical protein n=1 Tax=Edaphobacter aggregans TaxID=570835 RepID=UPI000550AE0B|nr:hypothetical protein [Edaphobacter aggregans]
MSNAKELHREVPTVMVGTGPEVIQLLHRSTARRALAVTFANDDEMHLLELMIRRVTEFYPQLMRQRQHEAIDKIVSALLPEVAIPDAALAQARMMVDAKSAILNSGDLLPAGEIAKLAGYSANNPSAQPNKWKRDGTIFAIHHKGTDYFPIYALNPDENYRPYKAVADILRVFGDTKDSWGLAFWFAGLNSFLNDQRPQDLLAADPERVIAAAKDEVEGVQHG